MNCMKTHKVETFGVCVEKNTKLDTIIPFVVYSASGHNKLDKADELPTKPDVIERGELSQSLKRTILSLIGQGKNMWISR